MCLRHERNHKVVISDQACWLQGQSTLTQIQIAESPDDVTVLDWNNVPTLIESCQPERPELAHASATRYKALPNFWHARQIPLTLLIQNLGLHNLDSAILSMKLQPNREQQSHNIEMGQQDLIQSAGATC